MVVSEAQSSLSILVSLPEHTTIKHPEYQLVQCIVDLFCSRDERGLGTYAFLGLAFEAIIKSS